MITDTNLHYLSREEIKAFQEARMRETLDYVKERSAFYKAMFARTGINPDDIRTIEDLRKLPVTTKEDLQLHNKEFCCVDPVEVTDIVTTSGTLGDPVVFYLSNKDLERLAYNEYSAFLLAGCKREDVMQLMTTLDRRFMAGLAYWMGACKLGMGCVRVGNGIPELQWNTINSVQPTVAMCVPSFLMKLIAFAEENDIDYRNSSLKKAICIGEALRKTDGSLTTLGERIHEKWPELELYSTYASTEMQASFIECSNHNGNHVPADLIIVEFLDEDNQPVPAGEPGEVTITSLGIEGMPLVRFKTGDVVVHYDDPCPCGRNTTRLSSVLGRKGQMIKFKGTTLYPPALFDILDNIPEVKNYVVEVYTNSLGTDQVQVKIGCDNRSETFIKQLKDIFRSKVRVAPDIVFEAPEIIARMQMPPMSRKVIKFFDLRNK